VSSAHILTTEPEIKEHRTKDADIYRTLTVFDFYFPFQVGKTFKLRKKGTYDCCNMSKHFLAWSR
jgi:hypothetical protein